MTEFNALVTDTHPLLFHANRSSRLSPRARAHFQACERQEAILYVPTVVIWESCLLVRVGKLDLKPSPEKFFLDLFRRVGGWVFFILFLLCLELGDAGLFLFDLVFFEGLIALQDEE